MRTTVYPSRPDPVVSNDSISRTQGRQIDWAKVGARFRQDAQKVVVGVGGAAIGATALPVVALVAAIPANAILNFGELAPVVVTVGVAGAAAGDTSIPVAALSGPIPAGTLLDFGTNKFARLTAAAAAGATALTVAAIPTALVSTNTATFKGGTQQARVTTAAAIGATSLVVDELQFGIAAAAVAYTGGESNKKRIPAKTIMAQLSSGLCIPRVDVTGAETAEFMIETDAGEDLASDSKSGYGMMDGARLFENLLPDADPATGLIPSGWKTELRAFGGTWMFEPYADSR